MTIFKKRLNVVSNVIHQIYEYYKLCRCSRLLICWSYNRKKRTYICILYIAIDVRGVLLKSVSNRWCVQARSVHQSWKIITAEWIAVFGSAEPSEVLAILGSRYLLRIHIIHAYYRLSSHFISLIFNENNEHLYWKKFRQACMHRKPFSTWLLVYSNYLQKNHLLPNHVHILLYTFFFRDVEIRKWVKKSQCMEKFCQKICKFWRKEEWISYKLRRVKIFKCIQKSETYASKFSSRLNILFTFAEKIYVSVWKIWGIICTIA